MGAAQILMIAIPAAKELILLWMEMSGKESITKEDLKTKSPDDILKEMGIDLPAEQAKESSAPQGAVDPSDKV